MCVGVLQGVAPKGRSVCYCSSNKSGFVAAHGTRQEDHNIFLLFLLRLFILSPGDDIRGSGRDVCVCNQISFIPHREAEQRNPGTEETQSAKPVRPAGRTAGTRHERQRPLLTAAASRNNNDNKQQQLYQHNLSVLVLSTCTDVSPFPL